MKSLKTDSAPTQGLFHTLSEINKSNINLIDLISVTEHNVSEFTYPLPSFSEISDIFSAAQNILDPKELLNLFIGCIESKSPPIGNFDYLVERWIAARVQRDVDDKTILDAPSTVPFIKSIFDFYFRKDLYGYWKHNNPIILSSGSFDETVYGLPTCLKQCLSFAIDHNWYGYSDSLGRISARESLAKLETARFGTKASVDLAEIVITLGGTAAVAALADFLSLMDGDNHRIALCGTPNYPPLLASIAKRFRVKLVQTPICEHYTDISELISATTKYNPKLVFLQTVTNPTGLRVSEKQISELIKTASDNCYIILDECHDHLGPPVDLTVERRKPNVITVHSISKLWAAPGLKAGWFVASTEITNAFYEYASTIYGGPPSITFLLLEMFGIFESARLLGKLDVVSTLARLSDNYSLSKEALEAGLTDYLGSYDLLQTKVHRARHIAIEGLADAGFDVLRPDYSINLIARFGKLSSYQMYRNLINDTGVSVYPGLLCGFGLPGLVRISPCIPESILTEAIGRIKNWCKHKEC